MRVGRPVPGFVLSPSERLTLEQYARRPTTAQALALRARIVLRCATGATHTAIAADLDVTIQTVGKWRKRFVAARIGGLLDEPRPGAPRKITDAQIERAIATTLESTPPDATHWSTRDLAKHEGLSQSTVARMWKAFALQPHRLETFKLSKDPLFIDKVRDIVGLYLASARSRLGTLCGREEPNSSARSHGAAPADAAGLAGASDARLRPARHDVALRRAGCEGRDGHRGLSRAASRPGVSAVPDADRGRGPARSRGPSDSR